MRWIHLNNMTNNFDISTKGLKELQAAVRRNPQKVITEVGKFLVRGIAVYNRRIIRSPWKIGGNGGGAPTSTGNLRDTHVKEIRPWDALIAPTAPYAAYVHGLNGQQVNSRGVQLRPWLDYAYQDGEKEIAKLQEDLITEIVSDLEK
jgi:phage gpG-like protein